MPSPRFANEIPDFRFSISLDVLDPVHHAAANDNRDELFETLQALVERLLHLRRQDAEGTPEHRMVLRQIEGLRYSREGANEIIETLDPDGWGFF